MPEPPIKVTRSVVFEEFLVFEELAALVKFSQEREPEFRRSQVFDPGHERDSYRRSRVLLDTDRFHSLFAERILFYLPRILGALHHPLFEVSRIESQITASNDGDYFHIHNDSTHANWLTREITFVYFFHREPHPFHGGELVLYDTRFAGDGATAGDARKRIVPQQNSIIFFESLSLHEILPVRCPSRLFDDSRLTMNGWLHR